jgi:hypothetical protein
MFDNLQGPGRGGGDITMELRCGNATCYRENSLLMPSVCGGLCRGGEQGLSRFARFLPETMRVNPLTVGNQDSLQRGLRQINRRVGWKPGLASKRIATRPEAVDRVVHPAPIVGNQDSLQRGLRPPGSHKTHLLPRGWKPGQRGLRLPFDEPRPQSVWNSVGNQDSLQRGLRLWVRPYLEGQRRQKSWKPGLASKRIATFSSRVGI